MCTSLWITYCLLGVWLNPPKQRPTCCWPHATSVWPSRGVHLNALGRPRWRTQRTCCWGGHVLCWAIPGPHLEVGKGMTCTVDGCPCLVAHTDVDAVLLRGIVTLDEGAPESLLFQDLGPVLVRDTHGRHLPNRDRMCHACAARGLPRAIATRTDVLAWDTVDATRWPSTRDVRLEWTGT